MLGSSVKSRQLSVVCLGASLAILAVGVSLAGWTVFTVVAWARSIPYRIVVDIDEDAIANCVGKTIVESYHLALRNGSAVEQLQVIEHQFLVAVAQDPANAKWVFDEYFEDLTQLVKSSNTRVSAATINLLSQIDIARNTPARSGPSGNRR